MCSGIPCVSYSLLLFAPRYSLLLRRAAQAAGREHQHSIGKALQRPFVPCHLHRKRATDPQGVWEESRGQGASFHGAANAASADSPALEEKGFRSN